MARAWLVVVSCMLACRPGPPAQARGPDATGFLKGQLHAHSSHSADSRTAPRDVARWYDRHGYDFLVFTDHEQVTELAAEGRMLIAPGVELTRNLESCEPPAEPGLACLLHVNALFVTPRGQPRWAAPLVPEPGRTRTEIYGSSVALARRLGGLAQLNHPNFHWALDGAGVATLARQGASLLEVANEAVDSQNEGDARHPSTEAIWQAALDAGAHVWGTATDDAHHYDDAAEVRALGEVAHVGDRGFVMVRSRRDLGAIRAALERGDFYASTGVVLGALETTPRAIRLEAPAGSEATLIGVHGRILARRTGGPVRFSLDRAPAGPVRVVVRDSGGRRAWTQPVWVER